MEIRQPYLLLAMVIILSFLLCLSSEPQRWVRQGFWKESRWGTVRWRRKSQRYREQGGVSKPNFPFTNIINIKMMILINERILLYIFRITSILIILLLLGFCAPSTTFQTLPNFPPSASLTLMCSPLFPLNHHCMFVFFSRLPWAGSPPYRTSTGPLWPLCFWCLASTKRWRGWRWGGWGQV